MARHSAGEPEEGGEPTALIVPPQGHIEYVPKGHRVVSDSWIRNRIISVVALSCFAVNIITWLDTREVNAVLIGAGVSLFLGIPILNRDDKRGGGQ